MGFVTVLSKLDKGVQKRFDSVCFFLMRHLGVKKSFLRYGLYAVQICGITGFQWVAFRNSKYLSPGLSLLVAAIVMYSIWTRQARDLRADRQAEEMPGLASNADREDGLSVLKLALVALLAYTSTLYFWLPSYWTDQGVTPRVLAPGTTSMMIYGLASLCLEYLVKTPMNPPAEKEKSSVFDLQPAPAKL